MTERKHGSVSWGYHFRKLDLKWFLQSQFGLGWKRLTQSSAHILPQILHQVQALGHLEEKSAWLFGFFVCLLVFPQLTTSEGAGSTLCNSGDQHNTPAAVWSWVLVSGPPQTPFHSQSLVSHGGAAAKAPRAQPLPSLQHLELLGLPEEEFPAPSVDESLWEQCQKFHDLRATDRKGKWHLRWVHTALTCLKGSPPSTKLFCLSVDSFRLVQWFLDRWH